MNLWLTVGEADVYFSTRLNAEAWTGATTSVKTAALTTAQAQLQNSSRYSFVDEDGVVIPDNEATDEMKNALCEQALFLLNDIGLEARQSLQAQGVTEADMVGETYVGGNKPWPISPAAAQFIAEFDTGGARNFPITK
jgi:hypothetical protein